MNTNPDRFIEEEFPREFESELIDCFWEIRDEGIRAQNPTESPQNAPSEVLSGEETIIAVGIAS